MLKFRSNYEYRQYLIRNGQSVLSKMQYDVNDQTIFCKYGENTKDNKYLFKSINDSFQPNGYEDSDLKQSFNRQIINMSKGDDKGMNDYELNQFKRYLRDINDNNV